ncbi:hypothetical protein LNQ51_02700 [Yersinia ruckeri]|uniref:LPD38 domain-containing protein n=1 Tax=Yersinia ruckeri TaxID=29486 RepID=UPI0020BD58DE|nr:LPD38 domain-containing protein [Yersinia ruckeri]MCK8583807.1 hypothetical protein [Yersinia ruckeri]
MAYDPQQQRPENQMANNNRQGLNIQQPGEMSDFDREFFSPENWKKAILPPTEPSVIDNIADAGRSIWSSIDNAALNTREAISKVPLLGGSIVSGVDAVDKHVFGNDDSEKFLKQDQQQTISNMTPQMQEALQKDWWDSEKGTFGAAWSDLRSYAGGAIQSIPEMALTMIPAVRAAKWSYVNKIANGASVQEASIAAARTASIAGKITEGVLAGGASSREVRDTIMSLPDETILQSDVAQSLIQSGMDIEQARKTLAEDGSTKAFLMSGTATGTFGGQGDKIIAKILTGQITKGILPRFIKGAVAEGVMEEFPQSIGSRVAENYAIQSADPNHKLSDDVLNQGLGGAVSGSIMGGTIAGASRPGKWDSQSPSKPVELVNQPFNSEDMPQGQVPPDANSQLGNQSQLEQPFAESDSADATGVPNSQIDDFRDTPAYLRQDPRVQGFADDSDVQRSLAEPEAQPTAQDLIQQQMESGEQGFTPDELSILEQAEQIRARRTPRLPAPGDIHPGEGFPMPGPIQGDEPQAGSVPPFTAGEHARGQSTDGQPAPNTQRKEPMYSRSVEHASESGRMTTTAVEEEITRFQREYNGNIPIKFRVKQTQEELYGPAATIEKHGRIKGGYNAATGTFGIVAGNISGDTVVRQKADLRRTLRHEVVGHYGLNTFAPKDKADLLQKLIDAKEKPGIKELWKHADRVYQDKSEMYRAEEVFAKAAEKPRKSLGQVWTSILAHLDKMLRKVGLIKGPITINELMATVDSIAKGIKNGHKKQQTFPKTDQDQFRQPDEPKNDASKSGGVSFSDGTLGNGHVISDTGHTAVGDKSAQGMRQGRAQVIANQWVRNLNGAAKINVKVVQTQAEAAAMMANGIPKEFGIVHAIYQPELSRVIVVADNMTSDRELRAKLRHEVLAHHGLASVIGDVEYDRIMRVLHQTRNSKNKEIQAVWREVDTAYRHESQEIQANEFLAHMAERSELSGLGALWDRFVSLLINGLKKAGIMNANDISPAEIRNILRIVAGRFKKTAMYADEQPGTREFDNTFSQSDALYSRSTGETLKQETNRKMGFNVEQGGFDKAKTFYGAVISKDKTELKVWLKETGRKLNTKTFDGLAPLKYAEDAAGIDDARNSAYIGARMAAGAGAVTAASLEHGLPRYNKAEGIIERQVGTGKEDALMGILDGLGNHRENFFKWIAGHRSERLMKEGKENNFNADEIAYMKTLNQGNEVLFSAQKQKYDVFIQSILDLQQDMGLIEPESRAQWEDAWYLPYYREAENGEVKGPWIRKGIANQSSTVRKLKGSDLTIKDPIENLFNYVAKSIDASMKNEAMRRSVVNLADTGVLEVIESPNKMDFERIGKDVVKVFVDGQAQLVQVNDPELYRAFTMIDLERSHSTFMKAARTAKKVLTVSTTSMPDFIIRNFLRDSIHSWAINKDGFKPVTASWAGFKKALRTDDSLVDMMFAGATFGGGYSNVYDPASTAKTIRGVLRRKGYNDSQIRQFESSIVRNSKEVMSKVEQGLHQYKNLSEAAENANRLATYEAAIKSGKSKAQAAFESRDLMDFSMMGASKIMLYFSDTLPFFNARMQGLSKLGRAIKDNPPAVLKRGGMITAASLALMALNWDNKRYEELQDWDKDTYWHAWFGDQHVRFPKPFEIGLMFGTLPERFVRALGGKDTAAKFGKLVAHNFMETMAFNPIPQVVMPIAEAYLNYDYFKGGSIENMADSNLMAGARYNDQTSLLMREVGEATNLSPKMMDHIITGYTGSLGAYVMGATNILMRNLKDDGETPTLRLDEMPVIKSFFRGADPAKSTQFAEDFYRMMKEAHQINRTINSFRKQGRGDDANELIEKNRGKLLRRQGLTATQKQVKALNARIEMVRRDRMLTAEQKRERIDRMMATRNKLVQQAVERVNPYFNK